MQTVAAGQNPQSSPLATEHIGKLITKFAVPAIMSFLVTGLYNIVDQIFIGRGVGMLGNAATNAAFPLSIVCTALALLLGVGSASNFNLRMGAGRRQEAAQVAGTGLTLMVVCSLALCLLVSIFLRPILQVCGATPEIMPYAYDYTRIVALGIPVLVIGIAGSQLVRADGSPVYSLVSVALGAVVNTILDPIFIAHWGMQGAALATVIGQGLSFLMVAWYLLHFKAMKFSKELLRPQKVHVRAIVSLGAAACFNQLAMMVVQIALNKTLIHYGALSQYGSEIPMACVGVISKVNMIYMGFAIGIAQGCQPIVGFNYGAGNYQRVKRAYLQAAAVLTGISLAAFFAFQLFPRQIVSIFGEGSELYFHFAERYFRIYLFMTFANGFQPLTSNFFTSIGKAKLGIWMSLTRQVLFLLPLILIIPIFFGIDGVMFAGPIADGVAAVLAILLIVRVFRRMGKEPGQKGVAMG